MKKILRTLLLLGLIPLMIVAVGMDVNLEASPAVHELVQAAAIVCIGVLAWAWSTYDYIAGLREKDWRADRSPKLSGAAPNACDSEGEAVKTGHRPAGAEAKVRRRRSGGRPAAGVYDWDGDDRSSRPVMFAADREHAVEAEAYPVWGSELWSSRPEPVEPSKWLMADSTTER